METAHPCKQAPVRKGQVWIFAVLVLGAIVRSGLASPVLPTYPILPSAKICPSWSMTRKRFPLLHKGHGGFARRLHKKQWDYCLDVKRTSLNLFFKLSVCLLAITTQSPGFKFCQGHVTAGKTIADSHRGMKTATLTCSDPLHTPSLLR